ncbi:uncharacterized protein LOC118433697 [Folsomia candida]|nr:uncharacterized protein LOC118433697 [Folsomia candida]
MDLPKNCVDCVKSRNYWRVRVDGSQICFSPNLPRPDYFVQVVANLDTCQTLIPTTTPPPESIDGWFAAGFGLGVTTLVLLGVGVVAAVAAVRRLRRRRHERDGYRRLVDDDDPWTIAFRRRQRSGSAESELTLFRGVPQGTPIRDARGIDLPEEEEAPVEAVVNEEEGEEEVVAAAAAEAGDENVGGDVNKVPLVEVAVEVESPPLDFRRSGRKTKKPDRFGH